MVVVGGRKLQGSKPSFLAYADFIQLFYLSLVYKHRIRGRFRSGPAASALSLSPARLALNTVENVFKVLSPGPARRCRRFAFDEPIRRGTSHDTLLFYIRFVNV